MNKRLLFATTAAVALATSTFAQSSPNTSNSSPSATQRVQDTAPSASPSTPTTSTNSSAGTAQTSSTNSAQGSSSTSTNQTGTSQPAASGSSTNTTQAPVPSNSTNQAQTAPSQGTTPSSTTQSAAPPASNANQAQSPAGGGSTNTAQQPANQQNAGDRSSNTNVNASVNINDQQRTRIGTSISHLNVQPLTNVSFSLTVGTAVPRDVRLQPLPADVVEIVPQYRGYSFVLVKDEIIIVEPSTYKIVTVLPYTRRSTASAPARSEQRKTTFSDKDREVVRKHAKARPVEREQRTTGSSVRTEIRTGQRVPDGVEIEVFPEEVYRDAPSLREYRYINRDSRTYIVEPREHRIIEEID